MPGKIIQFTVDDYVYRTTRAMDALTQGDILAAISPILASGVVEIARLWARFKNEGLAKIIGDDVMLTGLASIGEMVQKIPLENLAAMAPNVARELQAMPREQRHEVLVTCLSICQRKQKDSEKAWFDVWNVDARRSPFDDINNDLYLMLRIVWPILTGSLSGFFRAAPSASTEGADP